MFTYDIHAMYVKKQTYIRLSIEANSFLEAISEFFRRNKECITGVMNIYCTRPKSGDLALMAHYDGVSYFYNGTRQAKYLLTTKDGGKYAWNGERFIMDDES
ncbi:MAG: hypothetical protein ACI4SL_04075 [Candidatus Ornithospirochaeta sp.]